METVYSEDSRQRIQNKITVSCKNLLYFILFFYSFLFKESRINYYNIF